MTNIDPNGTLREHIKRTRQQGLAPDDIDIHARIPPQTDHETGLPRKPGGVSWGEWLGELLTFEEFNQYMDRVADGLTAIDDEEAECG